MPFLAVVSSPLTSSQVVYPMFFLNSATKNILFGRHDLDGVTRGVISGEDAPGDTIQVVTPE